MGMSEGSNSSRAVQQKAVQPSKVAHFERKGERAVRITIGKGESNWRMKSQRQYS